MSRRDATLGIVAVAALVGAGGMFWHSGRSDERKESQDFPGGHPYICNDCQHVTILSDEELYQIKTAARQSGSLERSRIPCAGCGSQNTTVALRCPNCGEHFPRPGPGRPVCPHCQQPFPSLFGDE